MPPPPPPPPQLPFGQKSNNVRGKAPDRNAMLSQIRKGSALKNVQTNDRSAPNIDGAAKKPAPQAGGDSGMMCRSNGPTPMIPPGGLFAQGMPKLRSTGQRSDGATYPENSVNALNRTDSCGSRSHPPSPASKIRQGAGHQHSMTETSGNRNFPSDLNLKGPAPAPPPANLKPTFPNSVDQNRHPSVRRSVSQTSLGPKIRPAVRVPPNVRPPPPPKSTSALHGGPIPPALPSKPPNVRRRQSFGVSDTHTTVNFESMKQLAGKTLVVPPPPPRNNSAPNGLNHVPNSSPSVVHVSRMNIAPPPPPSRPGSGVARAPSMRPPEPPTRAPGPPPPPHTHPAPPSQMKAMPTHSPAPPPPPARVSSMLNSQHIDPLSDFEARFFSKFHSLQSLPAPEKYTNLQKRYPSKLIQEKNMRRLPPPPPPVSNVTSGRQSNPHIGQQAMLHIQLQSRVFMNNAAHC